MGKTILLSSHYLDEIEALADRVVILRAGEIVGDGTPLQLLAQAEGASTLWIEIDKPYAGLRVIDPELAQEAWGEAILSPTANVRCCEAPKRARRAPRRSANWGWQPHRIGPPRSSKGWL